MKTRHVIRENQRGFTPVETIFLTLVIMVLSFTAWYMWQAQQVRQPSGQEQSSSVSKTPKLLSASMDPAIGKTVGFSFPDTWQLEEGIVQKSPYYDQKFTLTSPSGKLMVVYETSDGGLGGACSPAGQGTLITFTTTDATNLAVAKYVETTFTEGLMSGKLGFAGLMHTSQLSSVSAGSSFCDIYLAQLVPLYENSDSSARFSASITFTNPSIQKDPTEFTASLTGAEYEQAKEILLSTTVK